MSISFCLLALTTSGARSRKHYWGISGSNALIYVEYIL